MALMPKKKVRVYKTPEGEVVYGMMAEYATPADLYHAAEQVRDAGYTKWDVYSPFPVHGMEEAMGLPATKLPLLVGVLGLSGAAIGFGLQWLITDGLYPMVVQGKPTNAWESFIPITFEIGVIFTAFSALIGMLAFNGLPRWYHPLLKKGRFLRVSDDRFMICVESRDPKFDPRQTQQVLEEAGGTNIDLVEA